MQNILKSDNANAENLPHGLKGETGHISGFRTILPYCGLGEYIFLLISCLSHMKLKDLIETIYLLIFSNVLPNC